MSAMRKFLIALLAVGALLAPASPASAGSKHHCWYQMTTKKGPKAWEAGVSSDWKKACKTGLNNFLGAIDPPGKADKVTSVKRGGCITRSSGRCVTYAMTVYWQGDNGFGAGKYITEMRGY